MRHYELKHSKVEHEATRKQERNRETEEKKVSFMGYRKQFLFKIV